MKVVIKNVWMLAIFISVLFGVKSAYAKNSELDSLIASSGIREEVSSIELALKDMLIHACNCGAGVGDENSAWLMESLERLDISAAVEGEVKGVLSTKLSGSEIQSILAWYQSDLGKKIVAAQIASDTEEAYAEMQARSQELLANVERVEQARSIVKLVNGIDLPFELITQSELAIYYVMMNINGLRNEIDMGGYKSQLMESEQEFRAELEQVGILATIYGIESLSDAELQQYKAFLSNKLGSKFMSAVDLGLTRGYQAALSWWMAMVDKRVSD